MLLRSLILASLISAGAATALTAADSADSIGGSAKQDLDASLLELTRLRESIAAEKVPLASELSKLEGRLGGLRKELDSAAGEVDQRNLDLVSLRTETKLRQDEITYLGTLLDEYRNTFETRINVSELQRYEPVIVAARGAQTNSNLSVTEKFDLQVALVKTSVARLEELIGGARFPGKAIDPQGILADGRFALIGPVALFASTRGTTAGLALPQTGSSQPAVRSIDKSMDPGIASVVNEGKGILPLDPSRGGALKELVQRTSLIEIFRKGGPIMWPLLLVSILALGTVIERLIFLFMEKRRRDDEALQSMLDAVEMGDIETATAVGNGTKYFVCRALNYALVHREKSISNALMLAQSLEIKRFRRGIPILDTAITLAPLLGLLGTVTGMMSSFSLIGGELSAPSAITGGIAEALIATAFGLGIAITALIPFNFLNSRVEEARHELDAASTRLELLLHPPRELLLAPARVPEQAAAFAS